MKLNNLLLLFFISYCIIGNTFAQLQWTQRTNANHLINGSVAKFDNLGNIYVATEMETTPGSGDLGPKYLLKYAPSGTELWRTNIDASSNSANIILYSFEQDKDENFWTSGYDLTFDTLQQPPQLYWNVFLKKIDSQGLITFSTSETDSINSYWTGMNSKICLSPTNADTPFVYWHNNGKLNKYDLDGTLLLQKNFPYHSSGMIVNKNNQLFYAARKIDKTLTIKSFNSIGDLLWTNDLILPDTLYSNLPQIITDNDGNIYIAALAYNYSMGYQLSYTYIIKYNSQGNLIWQSKITASLADIAITNADEIVGIGTTRVPYQCGNSVYAAVLKLKDNGNLDWVKMFGSEIPASFSYFSDVSIAYINEEPHILVTGGYQTSNDITNYTSTVIGMEFSIQGTSLWQALLDSPTNYKRGGGANIIGKSNHDIVITGGTIDNTDINFCTTTKFNGDMPYNASGIVPYYNNSLVTATVTTLTGVANSIAENAIFTAYPNPFTENVFIDIQSVTREKGTLSVYDIHGKCVYQVQNLSSNIYEWDGKDATHKSLPSGIYLLTWESSTKVFSQKIWKK